MTNVLLLVIAALLLVMVIQNGMQKPNASVTVSSSSSAPYSNPHAPNPSVQSGAPDMGHTMVYQALKAFPSGCEGKVTLAECNSPGAQVVKQEIEELAAQGQGPRAMFDFIINKYGMEALTKQAQRIRRMRTGQ